MRYEHEKGWWVEIVGAADLPMCELDEVLGGMTTGWPVVKEILVDSHFIDRHGEEFKLDDEAFDGGRQSLRQWTWLRDKVLAAALDEIASPEA